MDQEVFRNALHHDPSPREEDFPAYAPAVKAEFFFVLNRRQYPAHMAETLSCRSSRSRISVDAVAACEGICDVTGEPTPCGHAVGRHILEEDFCCHCPANQAIQRRSPR